MVPPIKIGTVSFMNRIRLMAACSACIVVALTGGAASAQDHSHGAAAAHPFGTWGFDLAGRDTAVKPGDDFNEYANGTYLRTTDIPADKARFGPFDVLYENAQAQLKSIIETSAANPANDNARKVGALYASFMDEARVNQLGAQPLAAVMAGACCRSVIRLGA